MENKGRGGAAPWLAGAAMCAMATGATAGTVIELRDGEGAEQRIVVEAEFGRFESEDGRRYVLMDLSQRRFFLVDHEQRAVFDMSVMLRDAPPEDAPPAAGEPEVSAVEQGAGPAIAGYSTESYMLTADGEPCQQVFVSRELLEQAGLTPFLGAFGDLARYTRHLEEGQAPQGTPCQRMEPSVELMGLGMPLRTLDPAGGLEEEVVRVESDVELPAETFTLPQDYQVVVFGAPES